MTVPTVDCLPAPSQLLGVDRFPVWYPGQSQAVTSMLDWYSSPSRLLGVSLPTGSGKSLSALLLAHIAAARTVILTATIGLQEQYMRDAALLGAVLVKGQRNFRCALDPVLFADEGPCHDGVPCAVRDRCAYRAQLRHALGSRLVITNYAYWLAQTNHSSGLGDVGLLICDEAHQAFAALENFLAISLSRLDVGPMGISFPRPFVDVSFGEEWLAWRAWASASLPRARAMLTNADVDVQSYRSSGRVPPGTVSRAYRVSKSVTARLERLVASDETWIVVGTRYGYRFVPKWVAGYSSALFGQVPKTMLMSAVLSQRTCDYLGVGERDWLEAESYFPPQSCQVWHLSTARMNYRTDDYGSAQWVARIDQIIQRRLDRKGIVFTVSYDRARLLLSRSSFRHLMLAHSSVDTSQVVEQFRQSSPPVVLVSPTVTTGWDFPGNGSPQYIIIGKVPYPDTKDPVIRARHGDDRDWSSYIAMEALEQAAGRCNRSADDRTEVFIVDDNWRWFWPRYRHVAAAWFRGRVRGTKDTVPDPLV